MATRLSSWITPDGAILPIGRATHEDVARGRGFLDNISAVKAGWIRSMKGVNDRLHMEMWDAGDENAVDHLEAFLFENWFPRVPRRAVVELEIHRPVNTYIRFSKGMVDDEGFKDLLGSLIRAAIFRETAG